MLQVVTVLLANVWHVPELHCVGIPVSVTVQDMWNVMICNTAAMTMMTHILLPGMVKK